MVQVQVTEQVWEIPYTPELWGGVSGDQGDRSLDGQNQLSGWEFLCGPQAGLDHVLALKLNTHAHGGLTAGMFRHEHTVTHARLVLRGLPK